MNKEKTVPFPKPPTVSVTFTETVKGELDVDVEFSGERSGLINTLAAASMALVAELIGNDDTGKQVVMALARSGAELMMEKSEQKGKQE